MSPNQNNPKHPLLMAISLAQCAASYDEVPVGAIVMHQGRIVGSGFNLKEHNHDPSSHAEMLAIRQACQNLSSWRLNDAELFVTLEPCLMCAGLIYQSRIKAVHFICPDPKAGALGSVCDVNTIPNLNHRFEVHRDDSLNHLYQPILKDFFRLKRNLKENLDV
jgi:tRNA(adenine34) deaminase